MSNFKMVVDSCCDVTRELAGDLEVEFVPFSMTVDDTVFVDSEDFDVVAFIEAMKNSPNHAKSGCPTPYDFEQRIDPEKDTFIITITGKLSGCYESASVARQNILEKHPNAKIHIFDSRSATAGEASIFMKVKDLIDEGKNFEEIVEIVEAYIKDLQTMFVLGNLDNMIKNGRMTKLAGTVATLMSIYPILYANDGEIDLLDKCIGRKKALGKLIEYVGKRGVETKGKRAFITHCNCPDRAEEFKEKLAKAYDFSEILIVETRGLSTMYAADGGIVVSF